MPPSFPFDSRTDASMKKLNMIDVSFIFATSKWLYFSICCFFYESSSLMQASWYEFFSLAEMFKIYWLLAGIFKVLGMAANSIGLSIGCPFDWH
jgi:hypothetical protein